MKIRNQKFLAEERSFKERKKGKKSIDINTKVKEMELKHPKPGFSSEEHEM